MSIPTGRRPGEAPPLAVDLLAQIIDLGLEIAEVTGQLDALYAARVAKYVDAHENGATLQEIAEAAGVTRQGVKYILAKHKRAKR